MARNPAQEARGWRGAVARRESRRARTSQARLRSEEQGNSLEKKAHSRPLIKGPFSI